MTDQADALLRESTPTEADASGDTKPTGFRFTVSIQKDNSFFSFEPKVSRFHRAALRSASSPEVIEFKKLDGTSLIAEFDIATTVAELRDMTLIIGFFPRSRDEAIEVTFQPFRGMKLTTNSPTQHVQIRNQNISVSLDFETLSEISSKLRSTLRTLGLQWPKDLRSGDTINLEYHLWRIICSPKIVSKSVKTVRQYFSGTEMTTVGMVLRRHQLQRSSSSGGEQLHFPTVVSFVQVLRNTVVVKYLSKGFRVALANLIEKLATFDTELKKDVQKWVSMLRLPISSTTAYVPVDARCDIAQWISDVTTTLPGLPQDVTVAKYKSAEDKCDEGNPTIVRLHEELCRKKDFVSEELYQMLYPNVRVATDQQDISNNIEPEYALQNFGFTDIMELIKEYVEKKVRTKLAAEEQKLFTAEVVCGMAWIRGMTVFEVRISVKPEYMTFLQEAQAEDKVRCAEKSATVYTWLTIPPIRLVNSMRAISRCC